MSGNKGRQGADIKMALAQNPSVAPCFLPNVLAGNYWVLDVGVDTRTGHYTWGIISGGQPTEKYDDGCTTKEKGENGTGLWIFVRDPSSAKRGSKEMDEAFASLKRLGFTTSRLHTVPQEGCKYTGAVLK